MLCCGQGAWSNKQAAMVLLGDQLVDWLVHNKDGFEDIRIVLTSLYIDHRDL